MKNKKLNFENLKNLKPGDIISFYLGEQQQWKMIFLKYLEPVSFEGAGVSGRYCFGLILYSRFASKKQSISSIMIPFEDKRRRPGRTSEDYDYFCLTP